VLSQQGEEDEQRACSLEVVAGSLPSVLMALAKSREDRAPMPYELHPVVEVGYWRDHQHTFILISAN
jgi:hypothetical protein